MNFHHLSFHRKFVIVLLDFDIFFGIEFATLYSMLFRLNFGCKVWVYYYKIKRHLKNEMKEKETIQMEILLRKYLKYKTQSECWNSIQCNYKSVIRKAEYNMKKKKKPVLSLHLTSKETTRQKFRRVLLGLGRPKFIYTTSEISFPFKINLDFREE